MFNEDQKLLKKIIHEFAEKEIDPISLKIEREGISKDIIQKMVEKGFLGALAPYEYGGSNLDYTSYAILLEEIAKYSPSLAFYLFIQNSYVIQFLLKYASKEQAKEYISKIVRGEIAGTLVTEDVLQYTTETELTINMNTHTVTGIKDKVINGNVQLIIALAKTENEEWVMLLQDGVQELSKQPQLGFRGLQFLQLQFDCKFTEQQVILKKNAKPAIEHIIDSASLGAAAIALGMSEGALTKAIEYGSVRKAFNSLLVEFQPIAFALAEYYAELKVLENYLFMATASEQSTKEALAIKMLLLSFARRVAKLAMQVHGGYGYLEDFQIEKYYRDAMALTVFTGNSVKDKIKLANLILEVPSAKY